MEDKVRFSDAVIAMEKRIAGLYEKAAEQVPEGRLKEVLLFLAEQERDHESRFREMTGEEIARRELDAAFAEAGEAMECFPALGDPEPPKLSSVEEAIRMAITCEKDSILFFHSLLRQVEAGEVMRALQEVLEEEYSHLDRTVKLLKLVSKEKPA